MKKLLFIFLIVLALAVYFYPSFSYLQTPTPTSINSSGSNFWVVDPEVTFIGKNAARSGNMLDWTLQNYNWVCVNKTANGHCNDTNNPLVKFWTLIVSYIVVPILFVVILATAVIKIKYHEKKLDVMRILPKFA